MKNNVWFDQTHRLRPKKIEEGNWVLVYDNSLDNQHRLTQKFARWWFRSYVVMSANSNTIYHLADLDGMKIEVPVAGKRIKAKRHEAELDSEIDDREKGERKVL